MIPLCIPNISGNEGFYLQRCVQTTFVSSVGEFVDRFESELADATGATFAVATSAGTTALHAALHHCGVGPGDHVIIPSLTFIATANAVAHCHAIPVIIDVDRDCWCLDPDLVEVYLEEKCERAPDGELKVKETGGVLKALMPVFAMGLPAEMHRLRAIADRYGLKLIADAAAAVGATFEGAPLAESGADLTVVSFNGNKLITAGGGGAILGMDFETGRALKHLTSTARVGQAYDHDVVGFNYRMTNLQAAVGVAQLERLQPFLKAKADIARRYENAFKDVPRLRPFPVRRGSVGSHWLSGVFIADASDEEMSAFRAHLLDHGIENRPFWKPMHQQTPYLSAPQYLSGVSDSVWKRVQPLPCSSHLSETDQQTVIDAVLTFFPELSQALNG